MSKISKIIYFFITVLFFVLFDSYLTSIIINNTDNLPPNPVFDLTFIQNTGAAFSILQDSKLFLIIFSAVAILCIIFYLIKHISRISTFTIFWVSILIAGIFCNMYERVIFGYVRDFFRLTFVDFPVFNISDIFINLSVFAIVVIIIKNEIINRRNNGRKKN